MEPYREIGTGGCEQWPEFRVSPASKGTQFELCPQNNEALLRSFKLRNSTIKFELRKITQLIPEQTDLRKE